MNDVVRRRAAIAWRLLAEALLEPGPLQAPPPALLRMAYDANVAYSDSKVIRLDDRRREHEDA